MTTLNLEEQVTPRLDSRRDFVHHKPLTSRALAAMMSIPLAIPVLAPSKGFAQSATAAADQATSDKQPAARPLAGLTPLRSPHAGMLRYPDVSDQYIVFVYANDVWLVSREGGTAVPIAAPPGTDSLPRFSPDGTSIAFIGNYDGGRDIYTLDLDGPDGLMPKRVTHHPGSERLSDWSPDGESLVFSAYGMMTGNMQTSVMYHVSAEGGLPEKMPIPYGTNGAISPDGQWLAYTPNDRDFRTWKRYQGGLASDIWLYHLTDHTSRRVTDFEGTDTMPMWHGDKLYFLSDRGPHHRLNLYMFDPASGDTQRITDFADHDVKFPSMGPGVDGGGEIIFQLGPDLMLLDLASGDTTSVTIQVPGVRVATRPRTVEAENYIQSGDVSATGQRAVVEARGDIWTLPAKQGPPRNLTQSPDAIDRNPTWSPDGRWVAYASDANGEYNVYITQSDGRGDTRQLTDLTGIYVMGLTWSPDSKKILLQDQSGSIHLLTVFEDEVEAVEEQTEDEPAAEEGGEAAENENADQDADQDEDKPENGQDEKQDDSPAAAVSEEAVKEDSETDAEAESGEEAEATEEAAEIPAIGEGLAEITLVTDNPSGNPGGLSWSHDSDWIAYDRTGDVAFTSSIWIYNLATGEKTRITDPFFQASDPAFDREGKYLYYVSMMDFTDPSYDDLGRTFVYSGTGRIVAVPLSSEYENPMMPESDEETWEEPEEEADDGDDSEDTEATEEGDSDESSEGEDSGDTAEEGAESEDADAENTADESDETSDAASEESESGEADEVEAEEAEEELPFHPLRGVWSGTLSGFAALGAPDDEIAFTMTLFVDADGNVTGTVEVMGETEDAGTITWDEASQTLTIQDEEEGIESTMTATVDGDTMTGTWSIPAMGISGGIEAAKTSEETPEDGAPAASSDGDAEPLEIDFEDIQLRAMLLPVDKGTMMGLMVNDKNQLIYMRFENGVPSLKLFDINEDDPSEGNVVTGVGGYAMSGDGKKLGVFGPMGFAIINAAKGQSVGSAIPTDDMRQQLDPRQEWRMILRDVWRRYRDFFYVQNMHGVDWDAIYENYAPMVDDAVSREDLNYIIGELIAELNVGHAYNMGGGDIESQPSDPAGLLGCDFELIEAPSIGFPQEDEDAEADADSEVGEGEAAAEDASDGLADQETNQQADQVADDAPVEMVTAYRISRIVRGAPWDVDAVSPLAMPGVDVHEGDFLLAINDVPLDITKDPWSAFVGLQGDVVLLTVSHKPVIDDDARRVMIKTHGYGEDIGLRYRAWVEANRAAVEELSDGRVGYIYVPDTGVNGQNDLFRQFFGQMHKEAMLIDDRWNGGGQIPDRFIELLNRPATNAWAVRNGRDWAWPPDSHQGPKAMLINGNAGSGGDMFPWLFRFNEMGPLIGTRTWGGLVGIGGVPPLVDNGYTTVPNFGFYDLDGTWGVEGYGVAPDMEVIDDPAKMRDGADPQLEAGVDYLLGQLEAGEGFVAPTRPADPDRRGMGIPVEDR